MSGHIVRYNSGVGNNYPGSTGGYVPNRAGGAGGPGNTDDPKQARVTADVQVNPALLAARTRDAEHVSARDLIGSLQQGYLNVIPGELVFTRRGEVALVGYTDANPGDAVNQVFSAFNGVSVQGLTQEQFESNWQMVGIAWDGYDFADPNQENGRITVLQRGGGTTFNTGTQAISGGDLLVWRLPSVDPVERDRPTGHAGRAPGRIAGKHTAIVEPLNAATSRMTVRNYGAGAARYLLQEASAAELAVSRLRPGAAKPPGKREHYALAQKSLLLGAGWTLVTALAQLGIVTVNAPRAPLDSRANYTAYASALERSLAGNENTAVDFSGAQPAFGQRTDDEQRQFEDGLVWLGAQLGLVNERDHPHLPENTRLTHEVLGRQLSGACTHDAALNEQYSLARLFKGVRARNTRSGYADSNPAAHLVRHQQEYLGVAEHAYNMGYLELVSRVWGKAKRASVPGGPLDYVM